MPRRRLHRAPLLLLTACLLTDTVARADTDAVLAQVIAGDWRSAEQTSRDAVRKPAEALAFWGLKPGMSILEVAPGAQAWWTEILAPYAARTGGRYTATAPNIYSPTISVRALQARMGFEYHYGNPARYGRVHLVNWGGDAAPLAANQFDWVMVARGFHNFMGAGLTEKFLKDIFVSLKPGGIVAIEQHRANLGVQDPKAPTGYVTEAYLIEAMERAGFKLDARSELNANPKDTKDHPFGVWTLPPTRSTSLPGSGKPPDPNFDHTKYDAIGESDRMTLRFIKPAG
jgi:predicted methyltransferase